MLTPRGDVFRTHKKDTACKANPAPNMTKATRIARARKASAKASERDAEKVDHLR